MSDDDRRGVWSRLPARRLVLPPLDDGATFGTPTSR